MRVFPKAAGALAAGAIACLPTFAHAAEVLELQPVVVTSTRPRFPMQPQRVTIIPASEIQRAGALNLAQLLKHQTGFAVREYGALGSLSTLTMRGALGEGILILRDGVKLNSPERGGVDLSNVSLLGVKRVEVLHGAASGLYGSEAVGGVINLVSDDAPANRLEAGLGTWGIRTLAAEVGGRMGETRATVGLRRLSASNDYPYVYRDVTAARQNDALDGTELWVGVDRPTEGGHLRVNLGFNRQDKGVPGPVNFPSPQANQLTTSGQGSLRWSRYWRTDLEQTIALSHHVAELAFTDPQSVYSKESLSTLNSSDLQTQLLWLSDAHEARVGLGMRLDRVLGTNVGNRERAWANAFAHESWFITPALTAFGNVRLDHLPGFGLEASPRLGATYQLTEPLRLRAALGRAYRAPTLNDLYWPRLGNVDLRPERTEVFELGLDASQGPFRVETTAFFNRGTDTILWLPGSGGDWTPVNAGRTETKGVETKASYHLSETLSLTGGGTWLSAIDAGTTGASAGKFLLYRPAVIGDLALSYRPLEALALNVGWSWMGERFTTAQNTESLPAHDLWSATLTYAFNDHNTLALRGENLANRYYVLQPYYPMPGRTFTASWTLRF
ncbi:Vitamin B12 transporter BtuB precursor [compost metagenome]